MRAARRRTDTGACRYCRIVETPPPRRTAPVLLGAGENLLAGLDTRALGYECVEHIPGERAASHVILRKRG